MSWRVLLDDDERQRANAVVIEIVAQLATFDAESTGLNGGAGRACLLAYAAHAAADDAGEAQRGAEHLDAAMASLGTTVVGTGLWSGMAGVRFAIAHLADGEEAAEALVVIDAALVEALATAPWTGSYDLISGLCGIGAAALEGGAAADVILLRVLDHLESLAQRPEHGITWFTPPERLPEWQRGIYPAGHYNLGLAHGVPGVIALLSGYLEAGIAVERVRPLLRGAVAWLLAAAPPHSPRRFPAWLGERVSAKPARLAWCYGDAGATIALLRAARALGDADWEAEAHRLARAMAVCSFDDAQVADTGICHGAAGLAHIFNRLYQATGDELLGNASRRWLARLLAMRRPGEGIAGFRTLRLDEGVEVWVDDTSVVGGVTGIGLVLLAATGDVEPCWDRAFLCDVAPLVPA